MKELTLQAPWPLLESFGGLIRDYADAAYPPGGSECAQSARAGLLAVAERIEHQYDPGSGSVRISRRIKAHLKAAITYYVQLQDDAGLPVAQQRAALLLACLDGEKIEPESLCELLDH